MKEKASWRGEFKTVVKTSQLSILKRKYDVKVVCTQAFASQTKKNGIIYQIESRWY